MLNLGTNAGHALDGRPGRIEISVATVAIGNARNAGLLAVRILSAGDPALVQRMVAFQGQLRAAAHEKGERVRHSAGRSAGGPAR